MTTRTKMCEMCAIEMAKYACPRCLRRTCGAACAREHKTRDACDGARARATFLPLRSFTDGDVGRDYAFLERAKASAEAAKRMEKEFGFEDERADERGRGRGRGRTRGRGRMRMRGDFGRDGRRALDALASTCAERGVEVRFMASGMKRRKANTTRANRASDEVFWRCEWSFHIGETRVARADDGVSERVILSDVYAAHVKALTTETEDKPSVAAFKPTPDVDGEPTFVVFLEQFDTPANAKRWYAVNMNQTLASALAGKVVMEFPTFHVVPASAAAAFARADVPVSAEA